MLKLPVFIGSFVDYKERSGQAFPLRSFFCCTATNGKGTVLPRPILVVSHKRIQTRLRQKVECVVGQIIRCPYKI
jgi:hypothetical protein